MQLSAKERAEKTSKGQAIGCVDHLRGGTIDTIIEAIDAEEPTIVNAPPGSGKTHAVSRLAKVLDFPITYLTERKPLYKAMAGMCEEMGLRYKVLPSPYRECPSFDEDSPDYGEVKDLYERGVLGKKIHEALDLECDPGCPYVESLDFDPEEYDVLIGHYIHGYAKRYTGERVVVFDEFAGDGFVHEIPNADRKVTAFLKRAGGLDYESWSDLIADRGIKTNEEIYWWKKFEDSEVYDSTIIEDEKGEISKLSKDLAMGLAFADDLGNGWETTNSVTTPTQDWLTRNIEVARSTENDVTTAWMIDTPDLGEAESIVALDGTPVRDMWDTATGLEWEETQVVPDRFEKRHVFHEIGGKEILVAGNGRKPYHTTDESRRSTDQDGAITMGAWLSQDERPGVITTAKTIDDYERNRDALDYSRETMNYGSMLSSNEFGEFETGVVLGTPHPGDYDLKKWGALMGESVEGESRDYQARVYGETGTMLLKHFTENRVLQALHRFGRTEDTEATVFVNHECLPGWIDTTEATAERFMGSQKRKAIMALVESDDPIPPKEIVARSGVSKSHICHNVLPELLDDELVQKSGNGKYEWIGTDRDREGVYKESALPHTVTNMGKCTPLKKGEGHTDPSSSVLPVNMSKVPPEENDTKIQGSGQTVSDAYETMQDTSIPRKIRWTARDFLRDEGYDVELPEHE